MALQQLARHIRKDFRPVRFSLKTVFVWLTIYCVYAAAIYNFPSRAAMILLIPSLVGTTVGLVAFSVCRNIELAQIKLVVYASLAILLSSMLVSIVLRSDAWHALGFMVAIGSWSYILCVRSQQTIGVGRETKSG